MDTMATSTTQFPRIANDDFPILARLNGLTSLLVRGQYKNGIFSRYFRSTIDHGDVVSESSKMCSFSDVYESFRINSRIGRIEN